ncbi:MAG: hypothetical protein AAF632_17910 [Bacteroidota bacterium]
MRVTEEEHQTLRKALSHWEREQIISTATAETLRRSYQVKNNNVRFDWKNFSLIAFFFAIASIVLATVLFLLDEWLLELLSSLLGISDLTKSFLFAFLAALTFVGGVYRRRKYPLQHYSNEALLIFGAIFIAFSLTYFSAALAMEEGYFALFVGIATLVYGALAIYLQSRLLWVIALVSLTVWYGLETFYLVNEQSYFLGMNFPMRYTIFGTLLLVSSSVLQKTEKTQIFHLITYYAGLLGLLFSLWMVSIFGNHGDFSTWNDAPQYQFWYAVILLTVASVITIGWGLRKQQRLTTEIGIIFLLLNLYTRYFEYGWDSLHRVVFFSLMALSFWLIGRKAESVWNRLEKD